MGGERHTVKNLRVLKVDAENGIVVVSGAVPGPKYCIVQVQDAIFKSWPQVDPMVGMSIPATAGVAAAVAEVAAVEGASETAGVEA